MHGVLPDRCTLQDPAYPEVREGQPRVPFRRAVHLRRASVLQSPPAIQTAQRSAEQDDISGMKHIIQTVTSGHVGRPFGIPCLMSLD